MLQLAPWAFCELFPLSGRPSQNSTMLLGEHRRWTGSSLMPFGNTCFSIEKFEGQQADGHTLSRR